MKLFIIPALSLILTSAVYADAESVVDHRAGHNALSEYYKTVLQSDVTAFDSSIVALEFSDTGDIAILIMEFQATLSTPEGLVDNGGAILMVMRKVEDDRMIFAEFVNAGPVSPLSNLKLY